METKVALCLWGERIAPRYDRAQRVRIVSLDKGTVVDDSVYAVEHLEREELCKAMVAQKVETLICGGVVDPCQRVLSQAGINIIDNVIGSSTVVLERFLAGSLSSGTVVD